MTSPADPLLAAAGEINVIDLARAIIANPRRARCCTAGELALAIAVERMWEVCLEADLLWRALETAMPWATTDAEHHEHVAGQMAILRDLMAALRGEPQTTGA